MLDDLGLIPTLRWHLNRFSKRTNMEVKFEMIDLDERLGADVETVLYRVVQEALNNVAKHAEAKKALVRLERKGEAIAIYIKDDGKGFDVNETLVPGDPEGGIGLLGMQERVAILGGSFNIQSRKRHGTQIIAEIPVGIDD
jgi:signal transduction histidine kinase